MGSSIVFASAVFAALLNKGLVYGQAVGFCKDDGCTDCPAQITTAGTGYPSCVVYDTQTVFGDYGYEAGEGDVLYNAFANVPDPGATCDLMIRSPADITENDCGDLISYSNKAECSGGALPLKSTFMVQFCCGSGDCNAAGVPYKRSLGGHVKRGGAGPSGVYLKHANGTIIKPIQVGNPPNMKKAAKKTVAKSVRSTQTIKKRCDGWQNYVPDGEPILRAGDSQIVADAVGPFPEDTTTTITYDQVESSTTSFSVTVGDPFGIMSATAGFEFTNETHNGVMYSIPVPANVQAAVAFTPTLQCTSGSMTQCSDGSVITGDGCTPYKTSGGIVGGDYTLVY